MTNKRCGLPRTLHEVVVPVIVMVGFGAGGAWLAGYADAPNMWWPVVCSRISAFPALRATCWTWGYTVFLVGYAASAINADLQVLETRMLDQN